MLRINKCKCVCMLLDLNIDHASSLISCAIEFDFRLTYVQCWNKPKSIMKSWTRVSSKTSFVSKQPKLEPKLVSALSETRCLFRLFRFNIETGSFGVSNNWNKQKTNRNSSKFVQISNFLILHTISSVCFGCFDTGPKHRNKPKQTTKNFFLVSRKSKPKINRNRSSFGLLRFEPRKKINSFEDPLIENVFWRFFWFVSLFRLFLYRSETPKQTEINRKKCFLVSRNKPKNSRNRLSFGLFRFEPKKKFDCFEDTLSWTQHVVFRESHHAIYVF
jgi:hypothetical protein